MKWRIDELTLVPGGPLSEQWVGVHNAASRALWGEGAPVLTVEELLDIAPRRAEHRRAFALWASEGDLLAGGGGDAPVAVAQTIQHERDNTETAGVSHSVHPDHQRRGHGSRLLEHCEWLLREAGCARIHDHADSPDESGGSATAFALAHGYRLTQTHVSQDLSLPVSGETLAALDPRLDPAAYVVETAVDALPEEWLEDRALLARRMSTDAPTGDIDLDEQEWDAERVRQQWNTPSPIWAVESVVRHVPSGRLVGFTDIVVRPGDPRRAVQTDTLVLREHRGNALGLALKVANLRALQREKPDVTAVRTWNADTNVHMIAINERLGFRPTGWSREWAKDL
ncbi:acetyltransferase (GNAT) family protein [Humibacillus xanthopallidus]|uniref:Acetyltransferase (GNAT) family protein n=1 Tax=Humibacillus xanthopallidus TaxID=412689 RepID=A0A543PY33_9MICO|nr:GNAT family N-acetyltransferase [Humibacillus xanthopallidus]TQN48960.1 acetyltransferase (GNAT) family protein [Humibacillus xanthopallidus]